MKVNFDIDIDVLDRTILLSHFNYIQASIIKDNTIKPHNTGIYVQNIPTDPLTGLASIDYQKAEELGYLKLDILNNSGYRGVRDRVHLKELLNKEPDWDLLNYPEVVQTLFQLSNHYTIVSKLRPKSIEQLAATIAIIRPGKFHLQNKPWHVIFQEVWKKDDNGEYSFKKSHAIGYSMLIAVQMNLLSEQV